MEIKNTGKFHYTIENTKAVCEYYYKGTNTLVLFHTYVPPQYRGNGIASKIIKEALEFAKRHQLQVIPSCSAVSRYIERHPEFQSLLAK
jgi:predicted GNAT family acetyltransferase